ncbi:MAG: hypothetical protein WC813_03695 [Patescibacteria group bacterium]|jgi:hypothetical protein
MRANITVSCLVLFTLSACHPCEDCQETDPDCQACETGDTGGDTSVHGFAHITAVAYRLGVATTDSLIRLVGDIKQYSLTSGGAEDIDAPGDYTAEVGDVVAPFTFPVDQSGNDFWAAPIVPFAVQLNVPDTIRLDEFKLFEPGTYRCGYDMWRYDEAAADHKGVFIRHTDLDDQHIEVGHDGKVWVQGSNPMMDVNGDDDDYMQVEGDHFVLHLEGFSSSWGIVITASSINKTSFTETTEAAADNNVAEMSCVKR